MGRRKQFIITNLKCTCCGNIWNIPRIRGEMRERGHVKDVWCIICKQVTPHKDFKNEYDVMGPYASLNEEKSAVKEESKQTDSGLEAVGS